MLDVLRNIVQRYADTRWKVSIFSCANGYRVHVHLGDVALFRGRGRSVEQAEADVAAKIVASVDSFAESERPSKLEGLLAASIKQAKRQRRVRGELRLIRGGKM